MAGAAAVLDHHRTIPGHHVTLRKHALREGVVVLLLDAELLVGTAAQPIPVPPSAPLPAPMRGAASAADRRAETRAEHGGEAAAPTARLFAFCA